MPLIAAGLSSILPSSSASMSSWTFHSSFIAEEVEAQRG